MLEYKEKRVCARVASFPDLSKGQGMRVSACSAAVAVVTKCAHTVIVVSRGVQDV